MQTIRELFDQNSLTPIYLLNMATEVEEKILILELVPSLYVNRFAYDRFINDLIKDLRILELTKETLSFSNPMDKDIEKLLNNKINRYYDRLDNVIFSLTNEVQ
jgi:hypothetical protein